MPPLTLRICHLITDLDVGGAERTLVNLLTRIDRTRFSPDVVTMVEPGAMAEPLREAGIPVISLGMRRGRPKLRGLVTLVAHLRHTRPAVLQTWLYHADLAGTIAASMTSKARLVWNVRCSDMTQDASDWSIRVVRRLLASLSARPDAVIVNSQQGKHVHAAAGYHPKRWIEIPNGVDVQRFRPRAPEERAALRARLGIPDGAEVLGLVARFHPMKDLDTFLRAAAMVAAMRSRLFVVLCGWGLDERNPSLRTRLAELGLENRLALLGGRADVEDIYPAFDVLGLSSAFGEGFPNVLIEGMASGLPCAATDVGDNRAILGDLGSIVPPRDPTALARGIAELLEADRSPLAAAMRDRAIRHYGIGRMLHQYEELYAELGDPPGTCSGRSGAPLSRASPGAKGASKRPQGTARP